MRRVLALLLSVTLIVCILAVPAFAVEVSYDDMDSITKLTWFGSAESLENDFIGSVAICDQAYNPLIIYLEIQLPEPIEKDLLFDVTVSFSSYDADLTVTNVYLLGPDGNVSSPFKSGFEVISGQISLEGLIFGESAVSSLWIQLEASNIDYAISSEVVNGTPIRKYSFLFDVTGLVIEETPEDGFLKSILNRIVDALAPSEGEKFLGIIDFRSIGEFFSDAYNGVRSVFGLGDLINDPEGPFAWLVR